MLSPAARLLAIASLVGVLAAPVEALAGPEKEAAELAERGRLLFDKGEYAEALKRYRAAYTLHAHPTYLFNQGRAAAKMGECRLALDAYRAYVESPELTTEAGLDYARKEIERLDKQCGDPPTVELGDDDPPDRPGDSDGAKPGDSDGGKAGQVADADKPEPEGLDLRGVKSEPETSARRPWQIASYAGGGVTAALLGYWVFEANRLGMFGGDGHYTEKVLEANGRAAPGPITGDDICDSPMINSAGYEEVADACDAGNAASTRANVVLVSAVLSSAATAVFIYYGFIRPEPDRDTVSFAPGPGDLGISAAVTF